MGLCSPRAKLHVDAATTVSGPALGTSTSLLGEYPKGRTTTDSTDFYTQPKGLRAHIPRLSRLLQLRGAAIKGVWGRPLKERIAVLSSGTAARSSQGTFQADHSTIPATKRHLLKCYP